jgi:anti-sigma B factor antagonist
LLALIAFREPGRGPLRRFADRQPSQDPAQPQAAGLTVPGSTPVSVVVERVGEAVVVSVSGEVDALTAPSVAETVLGVLGERPARVVIDLLAVSFLGSAGLALLVEAQQVAGLQHTMLRVVAAGPVTLHPLQVTGLDRQFSVHATRDDALAAAPQ